MARTKYKRVPFDLELAKKITNGKVKGRIVTEDGREARIICFDRRGYIVKQQIIALTATEKYERLVTLNIKGREYSSQIGSDNLHIELPTYRKDYSNFVPKKYQPCLVRENEDELWLLQVSKGKRCGDGVLFYCPDGSPNVWRHCLPLTKITKRLIGTIKSYEQLIQELDGNDQD